MEIQDFKRRCARHYERLGINNFKQFVKLMGYSNTNGGSNFYTHGIPKRAIAFLELLERGEKKK